MQDSENNPPLGRRRMLTGGIGAVGAAAATTAFGAEPALATASNAPGLPVLKPHDDWRESLDKTPQVQLEPGSTYQLSSAVELPTGCVIVGNGATVTVAGVSFGALRITKQADVTLTGIRFQGQNESPVNTAPAFEHVGVRITRSSNVRVTECDFNNWRGAGVAVTGSSAGDYFAYRTKIQYNTFYASYFGISAADRSEYSIASGNSFAYCRLAIWNSSGNWSITGNDVVGCYGAYYSIAATSPYGELASDNWGHGAVVGNTFNHSNGYGPSVMWSSHAGFPIAGATHDPGPGVVIQGVLPPTFTGNTLWYTDVRATGIAGTPWLLSGCTFSNLTITATDGSTVHLVGTQANGNRNLPRLVGEVKDLLAGLG